MGCPLCERLARPDPRRVATLARCEVFLGDNQGCAGWCVLVLRTHVEHLDELTIEGQREVFAEVALVARAIRGVFPSSGAGGGPPRINYECLGNQVAHVHWHVIPRHADDPDPRNPVWGWPPGRLRGAMDDAARDALAARLRTALGSTPA